MEYDDAFTGLLHVRRSFDELRACNDGAALTGGAKRSFGERAGRERLPTALQF
jgi:hypothetical protein